MPNIGYRKSKLRSESSRLSYDNENNVICKCDAEFRLGYGVAVSLAIFEAKRFCLLALELFAEWQVIHFAGGYRPVVLTVIDTTLGFPCALAAVFTIRKLHEQFKSRRTRKICIYLLVAISVCAVLNILTMVSIGTNISFKRKTISRIFNASMHFYETTEWYKHTIDQIQLGLQCCGHTSYTDWFHFDWQTMRFSSRHQVSNHEEKLSGEIYFDRSVPFSCCNLRVLLPCGHTEMNEQDTETINVDGCSGILSNFLRRIVFVAYAMTTILVLTQTLLAFFLARIAKKSIPDKFFKKSPETDFPDESFRPVTDKLQNSGKPDRNNEDCLRSTWKSSRKRGKRKKIGRSNKSVSSGLLASGFSKLCQDSVSSDEEPCDSKAVKCQTARIKPSVHMEHRVPMKKSAIKRIR